MTRPMKFACTLAESHPCRKMIKKNLKEIPETWVLSENHSNISGNKKYKTFVLGIKGQQRGTKEPAM